MLVEEASVQPKPILGFFSLNICVLKSEHLPENEAKRLPRDVPGIKVGRLAVAKEFQGRGFGKFLLVSAMQKAFEVFGAAGGIGLFVDAKDQGAKFYYKQFGFVPFPRNQIQLFLPFATIREALIAKHS